MGWSQKIEFVDQEDIVLPPPVKKQVWDGKQFVPMILYKQKGVPNGQKMLWLEKTYGQPGTYVNGRFWDYSRAGDFVVMDEKVYTWFQMKWGDQ